MGTTQALFANEVHNIMKVAIIGAGFTGLAAAVELAKADVQVTVFESRDQPGGLAGGFRQSDWQWSLEYHYHHVFQTDKVLMRWLTELQLIDQLSFQDTLTFTSVKTGLAQLDSAMSLLKYPDLSFFAKMRTGVTLALLKAMPQGKWLERYTAAEFIQATMGQESWEKLWKPLFVGKFADLADEINASWFWARIFTRSKKLGYFKGGFLEMAKQVVAKLIKRGVQFEYGQQVVNITQNSHQQFLCYLAGQSSPQEFDAILFTGNSDQLLSVAAPILPTTYCQQLSALNSLAAMTLVLELDQPFFENESIYWLNVNRTDWPFLAVVEHTNMISKEQYADRHLVYVGKYLNEKDSFFSANKDQVLAKYQPFLLQLSPLYQQHLTNSFLFKSKGAQPVARRNQSQLLPGQTTPLPHLYFAGMQHVYPFDRGINYAIKLGRDTAQIILCQYKKN